MPMKIGLPRVLPLVPTALCAKVPFAQPALQRSPFESSPGFQPVRRAHAIAFDDAHAYERMTGAWSGLVGNAFLDWLAPAPGLRWLDAGCGSGAFTRLITRRCAPASVHGLDPEAAQIDYARRRLDARGAQFRVGDASAMPYPPASFDVAVMALVLVFLPDPSRGVAEMVRVLGPGGHACAYNWDLHGRGSPLAPLGLAMRQAGVPTPSAPSEEASREEITRQLWVAAGLKHVQTHAITVQRPFASFEQAWEVSQLGASTAAVLRSLSCERREEIKARFRENLCQDTSGPITCTARAIAVRGMVPR